MLVWRLGLVILIVLGMFPSAVWACSNDQANSLFHWARCWCIPRLIIWVLVSIVLSLISHAWLFPTFLEQSREKPMWPRTAMGWSLAIGWFGICLAFAAIFGWVSDELRLQLKSSSGLIPGLPALDAHLGWIAVLLAGLLGGFILTRVFRSRRVGKS